MRLNSQTHPRQTSPCASIPRHTTLVYEVKVIQQDRLGCRDPPMYLTFKMEGATNCKCYNIVVLTLSICSMPRNSFVFKKMCGGFGSGLLHYDQLSRLCECSPISCPAQDPPLLYSVMQPFRIAWRRRNVDDCLPR